MNIATVISLCAATLQLGMGALLLAVSRAPGWRDVRLMASLALTSSAYSATNVIFTLPGVPFDALDLATRASWLFASLHIACWALIAGQLAPLQRPFQIVAGITVALGAIGMTPGLLQVRTLRIVTVPWADVTYHVLPSSTLGEFVSLWFLLVLLLPFRRYLQGMRAGTPGAAVQVLAFAIYGLCAIDEVLVSAGIFDFLYLADVGFLVIVAAIAANTIDRVIADAVRLDGLVADLAGVVTVRDRQLDDAGAALQEAERQAALGRLAAGVGHEVNNPLTYLGAALDDLAGWIARTGTPPDVREALSASLVAYARIRTVVDTLRVATREGTDLRRLSLDDVVRRALGGPVAGRVTVDAELASDADVSAEEDGLRRMIASLVAHAGDGVGGPVRVHVRTWADGERAGVDVTDDGPAMPVADRERALTPYFTTHGDHPGLGLFLARNLAIRYGGTLTLLAGAHSGTLRRVELPRAAAEVPAPTPAPPAPAPRLLRRPRVLVVDDDDLVARSLGRIVGTRCDARVCQSGAAAIELLTRDPSWDVILCDLMMPGVSGAEVADAVERVSPALGRRMVFLTGGATVPASAEFLERPDVVVLHKPVDHADLWRCIDRVLAG